MIKNILLLIILLVFPLTSFAYNKQIALTLAGEAGGEGYIGMYAVACVIENRAKEAHRSPQKEVMRGFYGRTNKVATIALKTHKKAILEILSLLEEGKLKDITFGATNFENIEAFGYPNYIKKEPSKWVITCKIGNHTFFKRRK